MDTDDVTSVVEVIKLLNCRKSQIKLKLENKVVPKVCSYLFLLQRASHSALLGRVSPSTSSTSKSLDIRFIIVTNSNLDVIILFLELITKPAC